MSLRVLTIADRDFASRESEMLRRVETGLRDSGMALARAVPHGVADWDASVVEAVVGFEDASGLLMADRAPAKIVGSLRTDAPGVFRGTNAVDLVHVWGAGAYRVGAEVARSCGAGLVLDVSSDRAVRSLRSLRGIVGKAVEADATRVCALACDGDLYDRARRVFPGAVVRLVPWGVEVPVELPVREGIGPVTISVMCTGHSRADVVSSLDAIAAARAGHEEMLVFLDEQGLDRTASLQRRIEEIGLDDCLSVIGNMESARRLILETDLLIAPDLRREHRSLVLDALAHGMGVIVHEGGSLADPGESPAFEVLPRRTPEKLTEAILGFFGVGGVREERASRARAYAEKNHDARAHLRRVLEAYQTVTDEHPVPISEG